MTSAGQALSGSLDASERTHFVLVPLMAQGHTIPMTDMACLLAKHGAQVSFITTPVNASRMAGFITHAAETGLTIQFVELHFPAVEFGLPDGCENADMLQSIDQFKNFMEACAALRDPLRAYLRQQHPSPTCIISDVSHWWTGDIAREFGIPRLSFNGFCGFAYLARIKEKYQSENYYSTTVLSNSVSVYTPVSNRYMIVHDNLLENVENENDIINFPGFPTPLELTKARCPGTISVNGVEQIRKNMNEEEMRSTDVVINTFQELEALYIESFEQITGKKVWTVGPMCLCNQDNNTMAARGNKASVDEAQCLRWLDSMKPGSVIFVSFGSLACTAPQQLVELGLGLEASKKPFIWVIKAGDKFPEVEEWLAEGFEERVKDRGLIIRGWAPQVMILWHKAIAGFMTHCGWNSTIEGICAGTPMITWPHFAEQFVNERLVVDVLKTGVEVGVKAVTQWGQEQTEVTVTRDAVETAVSKLMDKGEAAEEMRMRAKEFGVKARRALEEGGSSYNNINLLIQEMGNRANASG
ncbi:hypothetical protein U9M48_020964 [Paspalum notatum var. saurae]|uniref:Glycosyltransferase n=1 Tax=Paspalum notatum var. saurae TaxID=547442 RepID=A0AAQ3WSI8_PASNO